MLSLGGAFSYHITTDEHEQLFHSNNYLYTLHGYISQGSFIATVTTEL